MMRTEQLTLLADTPVARRTDPDTSKLAAIAITESGDRAAQQKHILALVESSPGLTSAELAHKFHLDRYIPARRLPELRKAGLVVNGEKRICRRTRSKAMTWFPVIQSSRVAA